MPIDTPQRASIRKQILIAVSIVAAIAVVIWAILPPVPLSGERTHDFGLVEFESPPHRVQHTFELVNDASEPIQIVKTRSTCGCTQAVVSGEIVQPGNVLEIPVSLRLDRSGDKEGVVTIYLDNGGSFDVSVKARGLPTKTLRLAPEAVRLRAPLGIGSTKLRMESPDTPPTPTAEGPEELIVSVSPWKQIGFGDEKTGQIASWMAPVTIKAEGEWPPGGSQVLLHFPDGQTLAITVNPPVFIGNPESQQDVTVPVDATGPPAPAG
ncbi:MAG: DUF1573 domain-containing protein [Phycisphaerales bacterium]|jgi:hypothetical protein|nr:DUF1573 domain-containing protein [Phycisphaerales bacterium]